MNQGTQGYSLTKKRRGLNISWDCPFNPSIWAATTVYLKIFCSSVLKLWRIYPSPPRNKLGDNPLPGPEKQWVCGGPQAPESCPDRRKISSAACHNLSTPVCSPIEERGKNVQKVGFRVFCGMPQAFYRDLRNATGVLQSSVACHHRNNWGQRIKISIYTV
jgi:hypothetical protein